MVRNGRDAASSLGILPGRTMELAQQAARAVSSARDKILAVDVLAVNRSDLVSIHFAVMMDGGRMLIRVAMKVWRIESAMRLGLPESWTIAMCRKVKNTAIALKSPFRKAAMSVCFTRNALWL
jgi:hypothetical protein